MPAVEAPGGHGEVEGVERRGEHARDEPSLVRNGCIDLVDPRNAANFVNACGPHGAEPKRAAQGAASPRRRQAWPMRKPSKEAKRPKRLHFGRGKIGSPSR